MKKRNHIVTLSRALMALAVVGAMTSCSDESEIFGGWFGGNSDGLSVVPSVSDGTVVTRAASDPDLMEKQLNTLDVFVEHVTGTTGDGTFMKQYHLVADATTPIEEAANNLLAENWRAEGLVVGEKYNIYVATNNTQTKEEKDLSTFNVAALKALVADEVTDGIAVVNEATNNISWPWTDQFANTPSGFIYKQYVDEADADEVKVNGSLYGFTTDKEFMMDGIIENWTPDATTRDQVFQPCSLSRAAAKIVLNVKFDADFLKSLTQVKKTVDGVETWVDKPTEEQVAITGTPAWRFYNFAFGAPVFAPETQGEGVEVHSSETLLRHPYEYEGDNKEFQIITYTYPNKWAASDYATKAPSLVVSVGYTEHGVTNYGYYRIPLVKSDVTEIERNHIYVVNATIATRGSEIQEDQDLTEDIEYAVLPWNDENNSVAIHNEVSPIQHYYFNVNPKVYTLRGDGDQTVVLNYSKATGTKVNWKLFTYDSEGNETAVVANNDPNAIRAWFYNANGSFTTTYNDNESGMNWSNSGPTPMGVTIEQSTEGTSGSKGTVTVTSHALNNRAIKYIRLRVYLDEEATFQDGKETMYEDIIIRHFPTDNIQNIVGSWSSYVPASGGTTTTTLTTISLAEAEAWAEQYGVNYTTQEISGTDYISYAEYSAHAGEDGYTMTGPTASTYNAFQNAVQTNDNRRDANSQANAVADAGEGHTYYWGTNPQVVTGTGWPSYNDYDYYTGGWGNRTYYKYSNYYTATYTHSYSYTQYSLTVQVPTTGNWVDWERDAGVTYNQANVKYTRGEIFTAKVFNNNRVYAIQPTRSGNQGNRRYTYEAATSQTNYETYQEGGNWSDNNSSMANLTNNHMYVIQISSTSDEYVLGRPYITNNLSDDDVVSPAFMIASQLGAVTPTNSSTTAATHCSRYMEVAEDGTRYTGWRLPTADEISVITRYQQGTINGVTISNANYQAMTPVLTGNTYWSLTGNAVSTGIGSGGPYLRCVRDLSAAEVEAINGFDAIVEKYRN